MIIDFSFKNFKSFRDEAVLSFVSVNSYQEHPEFVHEVNLPGLGDVKLLKVMGIYGANASGKSNVIGALRQLFKLVIYSHKNDAQEAIPRPYFKLQNKAKEVPSEFCLRFIHDGVRYHFTLIIDSERVLFESLEAYPKGKPQVWYEREWDEEAKQYLWSPKESSFYKQDKSIQKRVLPNMLYLSKAVNENDEVLMAIHGWFKKSFGLHERPYGAGGLAEYFQTNPAHLDFVNTHVSKADFGISSISLGDKIRKEGYSLSELDGSTTFTNEDKIVPTLLISHTSKLSEKVTFSLFEESSGTQKFIQHYASLPKIFELGEFEAHDEIESTLHPLLVRPFIKLFADKELNAEGAQLLFTTHDATLLDNSFMRRDQYWITEKDEEGGSSLHSLAEFKTRNNDALMRGYLSGKYGGIPILHEDLKENE